MHLRILLLCFLGLFLQISQTQAQTDSLVFDNGDHIVGELKNMEFGVVVFSTDYSDSDFKIAWDGVQKVFSSNIYLITLSDGTRHIGYLSTMPDGQIEIKDENAEVFLTPKNDIVFLKSLEMGFLSRISASIDFSFSITRANNLRQLNTRNTLGYVAKKWSIDTFYNTLLSIQDSVSDTKRIDANLTFKWFLPNDWYLPAIVTFLSNNEQNLKLRTIGSLGVGKYLIHKNTYYLGLNVGFSFVNEAFTIVDISNQRSLEGYIGLDLNLFDLDAINLQTNLVFYPGISENGRARFDYNLNLKYDLPKDFYIRAGLGLNYDNRPVEGGVETDYAFTTGFGWEW